MSSAGGQYFHFYFGQKREMVKKNIKRFRHLVFFWQKVCRKSELGYESASHQDCPLPAFQTEKKNAFTLWIVQTLLHTHFWQKMNDKYELKPLTLFILSIHLSSHIWVRFVWLIFLWFHNKYSHYCVLHSSYHSITGAEKTCCDPTESKHQAMLLLPILFPISVSQHTLLWKDKCSQWECTVIFGSSNLMWCRLSSFLVPGSQLLPGA